MPSEDFVLLSHSTFKPFERYSDRLLVASLKMHAPSFLDSAAWLTFGRVRPGHLNTMIFGWASMAGIGTLLWLQARLSRVRLPCRLALPATAIIWHMTVAASTISILAGYGTSIEWLEFPPWARRDRFYYPDFVRTTVLKLCQNPRCYAYLGCA
jgi:hypothetical protein